VPKSSSKIHHKIFRWRMPVLNICMENKQLTVADMASLKAIIEAANSRGAFKATELTTVGMLYDKLAHFVEQSQAQLQAQNQIQPVQGDSQ
jgi:hypothetical protein